MVDAKLVETKASGTAGWDGIGFEDEAMASLLRFAPNRRRSMGGVREYLEPYRLALGKGSPPGRRAAFDLLPMSCESPRGSWVEVWPFQGATSTSFACPRSSGAPLLCGQSSVRARA